MKKKVIAAVLVSSLVVAGMASANWGRGGGGYGMRSGDCPRAQAIQQTDPAIQEKLDTFFKDTQDLRKKMVVKQSEKMAMLRGDNPDPAAVAQLTGEIFDLRTTMREKAEAAGVESYIGPVAGGRGLNKGFSGGGRGGQRMMGPRF